MIRFFDRIYLWLSRRRLTTWAMIVAFALLALWAAAGIHYEEDISKFLPSGKQTEEKTTGTAERQTAAQSYIAIIFSPKDTTKGWDAEGLDEAMTILGDHFADVDTAGVITDLRTGTDDGDADGLIRQGLSLLPACMTEADYVRIDSLIRQEEYVREQLARDKQLLLFPGPGSELVRYDPLGVLTPVLQRLQQTRSASQFQVKDGRFVSQDGRHAFAWMTSPYGMSESAHNAELAEMIDTVIMRTARDCPAWRVSAVGAPLVSVTNARQIKHDSRVAMAIAVVLILGLLLLHYRRWQDLLWISVSILFGALFALLGMALFHDSVSIIVLGIGSVIIGICVNYPLHFLDHLMETGDNRKTLAEMVSPLLIGNITTVAAFACLVWLDAQAMRDLGAFGALMLVGTILFVLVFLPVLVRRHTAGKTRHLNIDIDFLRLDNKRQRRGFMAAVVLLTVFFAYMSRHTAFDDNLQHINYMTAEQREGFSILEGTLLTGGQTAVSEEQQVRWTTFWQSEDSLLRRMDAMAEAEGFTAEAFDGFREVIAPAVAKEKTSFSVDLIRELNDSFNYIGFVCGFVVFFFLWLSFGRIELSLLSFLPLAVGWIWILGLMQLFGVKFNIVNIILATFIFGQGDDYTIFITDGLLTEYATGRKLLQSYKRSVALSAIIMFIGIGTLILARHPALRSLAEVTVIGMLTVVVMAYYLPPIVFRWMTHKKDKVRLVPLTLARLGRTVFAFACFLVIVIGYVKPYTRLFFLFHKDSDETRMKYHRFLQKISRFALRNVPGVTYSVDNKSGETFERPAVIICNHQSHLDLMCLMMLTPKVVFLTNNWAWHSPFYGSIIHKAEFLPVTDGIEENVEKIRSLYKRGYSIAVFPEGTRSPDCRILRFHKGAFYLAEELGADILPVFLHGAGHVLPKPELMLNKGNIHIEIGTRASADDGLTARERTRKYHQYYLQHYDALCRQEEDSHYWSWFVRHQYIYKGAETERRCRMNLKKNDDFTDIVDRADDSLKEVRFDHCGQGELPFLYALVHKRTLVIAHPDTGEDCALLENMAHRPENLNVERGACSEKTKQR